MKIPDREQRQTLAGEYTLGILRGPARRRYERLRVEDATYCYPVDDWETRLAPLVEALPGEAPGGDVWSRIESRLDDAGGGPGRRRAAGLALGLGIGLLVLLALAGLVL